MIFWHSGQVGNLIRPDQLNQIVLLDLAPVAPTPFLSSERVCELGKDAFEDGRDEKEPEESNFRE